jgi:DNA repair protein RadA/Sms
MLLAVLERRVGHRFSDRDVYVSTVGGVRLTEPGADLAIALALVSAVTQKALPHTLAAFGEISLAGEIRSVSAMRQRTSEALRLGFSRTIDSEVGTLHAAVTRALDMSKSDRERELDGAF